MSRQLSQPNNLLINHLGLTNLWFTYSVYSYRYIRYSFVNLLNVNYYLKILFKSGVIYTFHLFYHNYYFQIIELLTLPVYITEWTFSKFYRWYKTKNIKKHYLLRKYLQYMHISMTYFYRLNKWLLVCMYIYIPHIIKWKKRQAFIPWYSKKTLQNFNKYYHFFILNFYYFQLDNNI